MGSVCACPGSGEDWSCGDRAAMSCDEAAKRSSAVKALASEYRSLVEEPVEGFQVWLTQEDQLFEWDVAIFGPPETLYQGGYFKARMRFPQVSLYDIAHLLEQ